ncbi:MAG TPA: histidine kinase dimerization/phosphoacceptor domain-containing protein, partial [Capillimicrobium sp.]
MDAAPPAPRASAWERWLLPDDLHERPTGRRTPRDWVVDLLAMAFALTLGAFVAGVTWEQHSELGKAAELVLGIGSLSLLWLRRRWPAGVAAIACAASAVSGVAGGAAVVATFSAVIRAPLRRLLLVLPVGLAGAAIFPLLYPTEDSYALELVIGLLLMGVVVGWAFFVRARRDVMLTLRDRARRAEEEQARRIEGARAAERRRIAREMHDVLAHRLSLLSLHAGALEYYAEAPPEEVERAAGVIRSAAHDALEDLRGVIGVLR